MCSFHIAACCRSQAPRSESTNVFAFHGKETGGSRVVFIDDPDSTHILSFLSMPLFRWSRLIAHLKHPPHQAIFVDHLP